MENKEQRELTKIEKLLRNPEKEINEQMIPALMQKTKLKFEVALNQANLMLIKAEEKENEVLKTIGSDCFSINAIVDQSVSKDDINQTIVAIKKLYKELFETEMK